MKNIYVTGFIGADRKSVAEKIATEKGFELVDLDALIVEEAGRSILRLVMIMGEHEYRNKEYETLESLYQKQGLVVLCGDGTLFDDMCREMMESGEIVIADGTLSAAELWEKARTLANVPYAFMQDPDEEKKKQRFFELYEKRRPIYEQYL